MKRHTMRDNAFSTTTWVRNQVKPSKHSERNYCNTWLEVLLLKNTDRDIKRNNSIDSLHQWRQLTYGEQSNLCSNSVRDTLTWSSTSSTCRTTTEHPTLKPTMTTSEKELSDLSMPLSSTISSQQIEEADHSHSCYWVPLDTPMIKSEEPTWDSLLE